ncbi:hypothetical protein KBD11_02235 [Candidatus Saccharibacteria bacterium]|nr:hypothetical protein [Candidatus Saccharibacteria bacterium]
MNVDIEDLIAQLKQVIAAENRARAIQLEASIDAKLDAKLDARLGELKRGLSERIEEIRIILDTSLGVVQEQLSDHETRITHPESVPV